MNRKTILSILGAFLILLSIIFALYWIDSRISSEPASFYAWAALIIGGGGVASLVQAFKQQTPVSEKVNLSANGNNEEGPKQSNKGVHMPKPVPSDLSWLTFELIKELNFDACSPRHILDMLKKLGVPIIVINPTHDEMIRDAISYIKEAADPREPLLVCADQIWLFENKEFPRKQWKKFSGLICQTYGKDSGFRKMVRARSFSYKFPVQDLLDCH
jgi:hypothetical protein